MKIENYVIGMIGTNCYLVSNEETKECFLVDAADVSQKLVSNIREQEESVLLNDASVNASAMYGCSCTFPNAVYLHDGQILDLAGITLKVIYTPGHTIGGCCYYWEEGHVLFSGDTLFHASIGRTDLPTGSEGQLVRSIRGKLFELPDETRVCPGHMEETTIGYEKRYNPYV